MDNAGGYGVQGVGVAIVGIVGHDRISAVVQTVTRASVNRYREAYCSLRAGRHVMRAIVDIDHTGV